MENIKQIVEQAKREERERIARKLVEELLCAPGECHGYECTDHWLWWIGVEPAEEPGRSSGSAEE